MLSDTFRPALRAIGSARKSAPCGCKKKLGLVATRRAHRDFPGDAVEDRARPAVSDAADPAQDRAGVRRRPRAFLRRGRAKRRWSRSSGRRTGCGCPTGPARSRRPISSRASISRSPTARWRPITPSSRPRQKPTEPHAHDGAEVIYVIKGRTRRHHRRRGNRARGRRLDLFRLRPPPQLPPRRTDVSAPRSSW